MARAERNTLVIDFGTNSEIAFWDGEAFWVASAAGGPAFDGCGISCGMPAVSGAICRIQRKSAIVPFVCKVIGNGHPKGICGSGIVDAIALMIENGSLRPSGKFASPTHSGVATVLDRARGNVGEIQRIYVCGAFGGHLNISNAKAIGLLPDLPQERFVISGNAALSGDQLAPTPGRQRTC